ncbi:MAG: chemotaxis protein CheW [Candidatus Nitrosocaldaceae archaeon]|nr:MAG: chemotaxis protein CheW [Candidatus Nitrosocaldaceae archaeon]
MNSLEGNVIVNLVVFNIIIDDKKENYALEIDKVHEIRAVGNITKIPNATHILGIMNLRGKIISVIDTKYILGFGLSTIRQKQKILIVEVKGNIIGLLVDDVEQVLKLPLDKIEFDINILEDIPYIRGTVKFDDKLILILDIEKLLEVTIDDF